MSTAVSAPSRAVAKIKEKLDAVKGDFVLPSFLFKNGIFGSQSAACNAVKNGEIPSIKISTYRSLMLKEDVLSFVQGKYNAKSEKV